jgi:hypothetical protein
MMLCDRSNAYYVAKVAAITPFQIISALVFCFTIYGMTGLRPGAQFIMENSAISTLLLLIAVQVGVTKSQVQSSLCCPTKLGWPPVVSLY